MIKGIDVSAYQPSTYDVAGLDFVFTKITEGLSYINPRWTAQRDRAKSKGLVWGAYHYPHMANDPIAEADYFLSQVKWAAGDIIVLDWEGYDSANKGVPRARQLAYRDAWLKHVKSKMAGHQVGMYCNTDYWRNIDSSSNCGDFLWIATAGAPAGEPGIKSPWTFHQHSTAGDIDHDVAIFPDRAALAAWAAGTHEEDPMAALTKADIASAVWQTDNMPAGSTEAHPKANPTWVAQSFLRGTYENTVKLLAQEAAQTAAIATLASLVGSGVDTATVVKAVQAAVAETVVKVSVDVTGQGA
ncbi:glycoside hydrolase family 25 protein [Streptomyces griseoluteus]|uniref:glycoside hydrolase family 25 protein n=1 Tax=Streptomyces griseoluteus TaxID=29306 RepID=UPI0037F5BC58